VIAWALVASVHAATVSGEVRERGTGDPLPAFVTLDGHQVTTDRKGHWELDVPEGTWTLRVIADGHLPLEQPLLVPVDHPVLVYLEREPAALEVVVEHRVDSPHGSFQILDQERVEHTPGTHGDPFRLVQSLPGVTLTREYSPSAGELSLRGAAPQDSRFYLDGIEIPFLFHFQEYASVFHNRMLERLEVYPSTFGTRYGNAVGGIVEAVSKPPEAERVHGGASWSLVNAGGWVRAPLPKGGAVSASARRSYADWIGTSSDQYTLWPAFWDYLARYDQQLRPGHRLALTAFGAGDVYGRLARIVDELDPLELESDPEFTFDRGFHAVSLRATDDLGTFVVQSSLAVVRDDWKGTVGDDHQRRIERYAWLREDVLVPLGDLDLALGAEGKVSAVRREADPSQVWPELGREAPLLARGVPVDEELGRFRGGFYLEPRLTWRDVRIQPGLRVQWDTALQSWSADPRITVRWKPTDLLQVRAAAGRYSQSPSLDALSPTTGDPTLTWTHADQAALGVDLALVGRIEVTADLWGKLLYDTVVEVPGEAPRAEDGWAAGLELNARYRLRDRFFAGMVLTVGRSMREGVPFDFDQPVALGAMGSWSLDNGWTFGARYRVGSGLPYTPVTDGLYLGDSDTYAPVLGPENSARLPPFQKLDVRVAKEIQLRRTTLSGYLELWVVPPVNAALYPIYSYDYRQMTYVQGPSFVPLVGVEAEL